MLMQLAKNSGPFADKLNFPSNWMMLITFVCPVLKKKKNLIKAAKRQQNKLACPTKMHLENKAKLNRGGIVECLGL